MRPLRLDFAPSRRVPWAAWLAVAAGAFVAGDSLWQLQQAERLLAAALQAPARAGEAPRARSRPDPATERELAQARQVTQRLGLPWGELFRAIESAAGSGVALLAIEPDAQTGQLTIAGEATDTRAMFAYLTRLSRLPRLQDVHLVRHEVREEEGQRGVGFTVAARWKGSP